MHATPCTKGNRAGWDTWTRTNSEHSTTTAAAMSDKAINPKEVEAHNTEKSAWLIVDGGVYDVTEFLPDHPGGKKVLLKACGKDSSEQFWQFHSKRILTKTAAPMKIGVVGGSAKL